MIIIHDNGKFSATNMFQFDRKTEFFLNGEKTFEITKDTVAKDKTIIRDIKKIFNYNCNNFVTFVKDAIVTVVFPNKAYECTVINEQTFEVNRELNINIKDTLNNLKNGK